MLEKYNEYKIFNTCTIDFFINNRFYYFYKKKLKFS